MDIAFERARALVDAALTIAAERDVDISVAVTDAHGELVCFARMDGAALHAAVLARSKAYTAARDRQPTASLARWARETGKDMGYWSDPNFTGIGGGLPIERGGQVVGGIGVSGLSEEGDAALAQEALSRTEV